MTTCDEVRAYLDTDLSSEVESATVREHLRGCAECAALFENRTRARVLLRRAVTGQAVPAGLEARVRASLRAPNPWWRLNLMWAQRPVTAAAAVALLLAAWVLLRPREVGSELAASILRIGLGDHVHCSLYRQYPQEPPSAAEMSGSLGQEYAGLVALVREKVPDHQVVLAHKCDFQGRNFVHLTLKNGQSLISLIVTRRQGQAFPPAGPGIHSVSEQGLAASGFETRDFFVFIVSGLAVPENQRIASELAAGVRSVLAPLEG